MGSLHEFLGKFSTHLFHIEHRVFRSNHYAQGVIALYRMGAPNSRLLKFTNWYLPRLEDANNFVLPETSRSMVNIERMKGKCQAYHMIRDHFWSKLRQDYAGDRTELIRHEFPKLSSGLSSGAFHGTIHTGYGYSVGSDVVVCEGLAYLYHSYLPLVASEAYLKDLAWRGTDPLLAILKDAAADKAVRADADSGNHSDMAEKRGVFQARMAQILSKHGDQLVEWANRLKIPTPLNMDVIGTLLVDLALTVYMTSTVRNDFFLLHSVSSSWALKELLPVFTDQEEQMKIVRVYLASLLSCYLSQNAPELNLDFLTNDQAETTDWDAILERTMDGNRDEHVLKVVQICYDMATDYPDKDRFYKTAALVALDYPFAQMGFLEEENTH